MLLGGRISSGTPFKKQAITQSFQAREKGNHESKWKVKNVADALAITTQALSLGPDKDGNLTAWPRTREA